MLPGLFDRLLLLKFLFCIFGWTYIKWLSQSYNLIMHILTPFIPPALTNELTFYILINMNLASKMKCQKFNQIFLHFLAWIGWQQVRERCFCLVQVFYDGINIRKVMQSLKVLWVFTWKHIVATIISLGASTSFMQSLLWLIILMAGYLIFSITWLRFPWWWKTSNDWISFGNDLDFNLIAWKNNYFTCWENGV